MATKTKKPTAAEAVAKMRQAIIDVPAPIAPPTDLLMVPVELIDCAAQVRTFFDDDRIEELAADIAAQGVLQPVLLARQDDGRYRMIAGERRLRACRLANITHIPAIVGSVDRDRAVVMQLAENIQREDLSLSETAQAIRKLFDQLGSLQAVADVVHKSKPWVSKRLSVTCEGFGWRAKNLLEAGECEDLETLHALSKIEELAPYNRNAEKTANHLAQMIRNGIGTREAARHHLAEVKEKMAEEEAERRNQLARINETKAAAAAAPIATAAAPIAGSTSSDDEDEDAPVTPAPYPLPNLRATIEELIEEIEWINTRLRQRNLGEIDDTGARNAIDQIRELESNA